MPSTASTYSIYFSPSEPDAKTSSSKPLKRPNHPSQDHKQATEHVTKKSRKDAMAEIWSKYQFRPIQKELNRNTQEQNIQPEASLEQIDSDFAYAQNLLAMERRDRGLTDLATQPKLKESNSSITVVTRSTSHATQKFKPSTTAISKTPSPKSQTQPQSESQSDTQLLPLDPTPEELDQVRALIASNTALTPFRVRVLTLLTQVPRGRYTTYKALAEAVAQTSFSSTISTTSTMSSTTKSGPRSACARAIGSAMARNPYAPTVPCHRVLASDGKIGGFGGDWGEDGRFVGEKRRLLRSEGLMFDVKGKVVGEVWKGFV